MSEAPVRRNVCPGYLDWCSCPGRFLVSVLSQVLRSVTRHSPDSTNVDAVAGLQYSRASMLDNKAESHDRDSVDRPALQPFKGRPHLRVSLKRMSLSVVSHVLFNSFLDSLLRKGFPSLLFFPVPLDDELIYSVDAPIASSSEFVARAGHAPISKHLYRRKTEILSIDRCAAR